MQTTIICMMKKGMLRSWFSPALLSLFLALPVFAKSFSEKAGPYDLNFSIRPFPIHVGDHQIRVKVTEANGNPISGAQVTVQTDMAGMPMGVRPFPLSESSPGVYQGTTTISMQGLWDLIVRVNGGQGEGKAVFQAETRKEAIPSWLSWIVILALIGLAFWLSPRRYFVPLLLFIGIVLLVFLSTRTLLKKPAVNSMGMKMNMNAPNMGMEPRLFSVPAPVSIETIKRRPINQTVTYTGTVVPDLEETVYPRVTGWLSNLKLYPGDSVNAGGKIATLDSAQLDEETVGLHGDMRNVPHDVIATQLGAEAAKEREQQSLNELRKAEANLAYRQKEFSREKFLLKEGAISKSEYDKEKAEYESALSDMEAQKNAVAIASKEREISAHAFQIVQDYRVLRAHISGVVTERMVNEGVLIQPGTPILKIAKLDRLRIQVNAAESDLGQIHIGTPVVIRSPKLPDKTLSAKVTSVFHQVDSTSRTGKVEAYIENPEQKLFPGDFVDVALGLSEKQNVLSVPKRSVIPYENGFIVWIVNDGLAERKRVIPGISNGERIEIRLGLNEGDKVIFAGQEDLVPDQPVKEGPWGSQP